MAAPTGNQYWQLAKQSLGRKRKISSAEEFDKLFLEYIDWTEANPILSKVATKCERDAPTETDPENKRNELRFTTTSKRRPLSTYGLCAYLGVSDKWFTNTIRNLENKESRTEEEEDLLTSFTRAATIIRMQQFDGGCVGDFNPSIVTRALQLNDNVDITTNGEEIKSSQAVINILRDPRRAEGQ